MEIALSLLAPIGDDDLLELSLRNEPLRLERDAAGRLLVSPPAGGDTGRRNSELIRQVGNWNVEAGGGGAAFDSSAGFRLDDSSVLSPDAAWVSRERSRSLPAQVRAGFWPIAPDVAIELLSKRGDLAQTRSKIRAYLANGVRVAVLLDPHRRTVETSTEFNPQPVTLIGERLVVPATLLDGATADLEIDVARIFAI